MTKPSSMSQQGSKSPKRPNLKKQGKPHKHSGMTKHDRVLGLLRAKAGATIATISKATGWQPHSVRGFLAGVVKKKLGLILTSEKAGSGRIYHVLGSKPSVSTRSPSMPQERTDA